LPETVTANPALKAEIDRRRTFAIISHPDAGKTTLTEKLLLYAGAIELAGAVRGRKTERHVVSDWMDIERERGISVTSAAVEFDIGGRHLTLKGADLDTYSASRGTRGKPLPRGFARVLFLNTYAFARLIAAARRAFLRSAVLALMTPRFFALSIAS